VHKLMCQKKLLCVRVKSGHPVSPSPQIINRFPPSFNTCFLHPSIHCPATILGPKASASQRKLSREISVQSEQDSHPLQQSLTLASPTFPLFLLTAAFKIRLSVQSHTCREAERATHPGIEPHRAHGHSGGPLALLLHLPRDPQPTPWGRQRGQTDHSLTQHSFSYGCTEGRDFTQAASLRCPETWQEQSSIPLAAQHQGRGERSLWTNPSSAPNSTWRFLSSGGSCCADSHPLCSLPYTENRDTCKNTTSRPASMRDTCQVC